MPIVHQTQLATVHAGDCLDVLRELPDESVHAVITDPPYGLSNTTPAQVAECLREWANGNTAYTPAKRGGFMGNEWDSFVPPPAVWSECLRVLKPGGHILAFAGSRTQDLMGMSVRLAGFDIRDNIAWLSSATFPKSMDVSKAMDRQRDDKTAVLAVTTRLSELAESAGISRKALDQRMGTSDMGGWWLSRLEHRCACPSVENWAKIRNIIPGAEALDDEVWRLNGRKGSPGENWGRRQVVGQRAAPKGHAFAGATYGGKGEINEYSVTKSHSENAKRWQGWGTGLKPIMEPVIVARKPFRAGLVPNIIENGTGALNIDACRVDGGRHPANAILDESQASALERQTGGGESKFFYCPKASRGERPVVDGTAHPTVKPLALMRYLIKLVTPPGGTILDPFAGSGTTLEAATLEGFTSIGVEAHPDYLPLIAHRLDRNEAAA